MEEKQLYGYVKWQTSEISREKTFLERKTLREKLNLLRYPNKTAP